MPTPSSAHKKVLVLDLDDTLVCAAGSARRYAVPPSCSEAVPTPSGAELTFLWLRPHVRLFLSVASRWYRLVVFSAASEAYVASVMDLLDPQRRCLRRRFSRQDCALLHRLPNGATCPEGWWQQQWPRGNPGHPLGGIPSTNRGTESTSPGRNAVGTAGAPADTTPVKPRLPAGTTPCGYTKDLRRVLQHKVGHHAGERRNASHGGGGSGAAGGAGAAGELERAYAEALATVVLLDNERQSFWLQPENGIYLAPFRLPPGEDSQQSPLTRSSGDPTAAKVGGGAQPPATCEERQSSTVSSTTPVAAPVVDDGLLSALPVLEALAHVRDVRAVLRMQAHVEPLRRSAAAARVAIAAEAAKQQASAPASPLPSVPAT